MALSILAVLNVCKDIEIPFVFGGDGASILVPSTYFTQTKETLLSTKKRSIVHFVDAADPGYAMAAIGLKK